MPISGNSHTHSGIHQYVSGKSSTQSVHHKRRRSEKLSIKR